MRLKEKKLIAYLGLLVSTAILFMILIFALDFAYIKLRLECNYLMNCMKEQNYAGLYSNLTEDYQKTLNEFSKEHKSLVTKHGEIIKYRYDSIHRNSRQKEARELVVNYDVDTDSDLQGKIAVAWTFVKHGFDWQVKDIKIFRDSEDTIYSLKSGEICVERPFAEVEGSINIENAKIFADGIIECIFNGNYEDVYDKAYEELKTKGSVQDFTYYVKSAREQWSDLAGFELLNCETGKGNLEMKLRYGISDKNSEKIAQTDIWVKDEDGMYLSGIKFSENSW